MANPEISPNIVEAISFRADLDLTGGNVMNRNHGTAVAEIIVGVAPDLGLLLYNFDITVSFANFIDYIVVEAEADIISMLLGWFNVGAYDGTSMVSQKIGDARDAGMLYAVSTGNSTRDHWDGVYLDTNADDTHESGPGDWSLAFTASAGSQLGIFLS
jgi:hypothetical protein